MIKRGMILAIICAVTVTTYAEAVVLPVDGKRQAQTNWCWASSTQAIVRWLGGSVSQCTLANELREASGWGADDCCSYGFRTLLDPATEEYYRCNQGNWLFYYGFLPVESLLLNRGIDTQRVWGVLTQNGIQTEIDAGRPFIFRWDWIPGPEAHAQVCVGQVADNTYYYDPWPVNNEFQVCTYDWFYYGANDHAWTRTLKTIDSPDPPIPDIKVNGFDGTYYASTSTSLSITVSLNDGNYQGTQADWWVMGYFSGVSIYLDQGGNWTTTPSTWSQADLADISSVILSGTLGVGTYTIYFGVDLTRDGVIDDPMYYDYITIVVQ